MSALAPNRPYLYLSKVDIVVVVTSDKNKLLWLFMGHQCDNRVIILLYHTQ